MLLLGALTITGCASFERSRFELRVRSPERVALENDGAAIVPEGKQLAPRVAVTLPEGEYRAARAADGAITLELPSTWAFGGPSWDTIVDARGKATLATSDGVDAIVSGDSVRVPVCHTWSHGSCRIRLDLRTPRENVEQLDEVAEVPRLAALPFGLLGVSLGALGAVETALEPHTGGRTAVAASAFTVGAASLVVAALYLFAPAHRRVLVAPATREPTAAP